MAALPRITQVLASVASIPTIIADIYTSLSAGIRLRRTRRLAPHVVVVVVVETRLAPHVVETRLAPHVVEKRKERDDDITITDPSWGSDAIAKRRCLEQELREPEEPWRFGEGGDPTTPFYLRKRKRDLDTALVVDRRVRQRLEGKKVVLPLLRGELEQEPWKSFKHPLHFNKEQRERSLHLSKQQQQQQAVQSPAQEQHQQQSLHLSAQQQQQQQQQQKPSHITDQLPPTAIPTEEAMREFIKNRPTDEDWAKLVAIQDDSDLLDSSDDEGQTEAEMLASLRKKKMLRKAQRSALAQANDRDYLSPAQQKALDHHKRLQKCNEDGTGILRNIFARQVNNDPEPDQYKIVKIWDPETQVNKTVKQRNANYDIWHRRQAEKKAASSIRHPGGTPPRFDKTPKKSTASPTTSPFGSGHQPLRYTAASPPSAALPKPISARESHKQEPESIFAGKLPAVGPPKPYTGLLDSRSQLSKYMQSEGRRLNPQPLITPPLTDEESAANLDELSSISLAEKEEEEEQIDPLAIPRSHFNKFLQPLPPFLDAKVTSTLQIPSPSTPVATTVSGTELLRSDIASILQSPHYVRPGDPSGWLNDEVINAFFTNLVSALNDKAGHTRGKPAPYAAYSSAWVATVAQKGVEGIKRWSKRQGIEGSRILGTDAVFFPINTGFHWTLVAVSGKNRRITHFDSLDVDTPFPFVPSSSTTTTTTTTPASTDDTKALPQLPLSQRSKYRKSTPHIATIRAWLSLELGNLYIPDEWIEDDRRSPIQNNGSDCGMFTCLNGLAYALGFEDPRGELKGHDDDDDDDGDDAQWDVHSARRGVVGMLVNGGFVGDFSL